MPEQQCEQCATPYGTLQRAGECHLFDCRECGHDSCERCVVAEPVGWSVRLLRCPWCSSDSLNERDLREQFTIYSGVAELTKKPHVIAMLHVPRSCYPKRNESLINEILPILVDFDPSFLLLDENDPLTRKAISDWFPHICNPDTTTGNGAVIWLRHGQPIASLRGGPYLAKLELLDYSRKAWS